MRSPRPPARRRILLCTLFALSLSLAAGLRAQITLEGYGSGCPGTRQVTPSIGFRGNLGLGATIEWIVVRARPNSTAVLIFGAREFKLPLGGACTLLVLPIVTQPTFTDGLGLAGVPVPIPNDPRLKNVPLLFQYYVDDPSGAAFGRGAVTNGVRYTIR